MAHVINTSPVTFADRIAAAKAGIKLAMARRAAYRRTYNELAGLSDRDLADLGLHRSAIRRLSLEAAQRV
ncbi:DUF1127 domain-containing protein [Arenibacterium halophilum]|jgi:uncharacterized protein YjiS (DUF1127 family)|uniref:DUF1127 domain-containing protein n=1 Tax=Arenibacterium halophilum TaxID=2583821 RepID=A0ABY2XEW7_9RHOB|nr:DUF1127 domain-containing protein [Arenibacterium halophilum]MAY87132.1 hypothetical protein [Pseudooceanicola sp.]TMV15580.1 DUF1127 domain-containing protein [Arenibacterium halophilum]|tara:strand:- start:34 stop:243 length:210 start_codon:yes stop_codon:yes gene_type:complete